MKPNYCNGALSAACSWRMQAAGKSPFGNRHGVQAALISISGMCPRIEQRRYEGKTPATAGTETFG